MNGKVEIDGGASLSSENHLAIISEDDIIIQGEEKRSYLQGLVYTNGDLMAENITLIGSFVANRDSSVDPGSRLSLSNVQIVHDPAKTKIGLGIRDFSVFIDRDRVDITINLDIADKHQELFENLMVKEWKPNDPVWREKLMQVASSAKMEWWSDLEGSGSILVPRFDKPEYIADYLRKSELLRGENFYKYSSGHASPANRRMGDGFHFYFDLNEFLAPESRHRIVLWRTS